MPRIGSWNTSPSAAWPPRNSVSRSCASSVRRAPARRPSGARSPKRSAASSCACRWAGSGMRPRSAATGARISAHYLELAYDLSRVMFVTTANTLTNIPPALLDRLEVIEFPGYIEEEKLVIARRYLIPRQMEQNGLPEGTLVLNDPALRAIIREYTWEAGVRNLEREIGKVCRKVARRKAEGKIGPKSIPPAGT